MSARRIAVVTGGRPDYGLLRWLIQEINDSPGADLQLVATGMHLAAEFGRTIEEIRRDGLPIAAEVEMLEPGDSRLSAARACGTGVIGCAEAFDRLKPEIVVVLGDRFEILAAAEAAMLLGIPLAHLHGGETTEGSMDEFIRHAITKLSSLHFVSTPQFRDRVIRMGEQPDRVFVVGAIGLDQFNRIQLPDRAQLLTEIGLPSGDPFFVATYHAATRSPQDPVEAERAMLAAIDGFRGFQVVLTQANADPGGHAINAALTEYVRQRGDRAVLAASLGSRVYLAAVAHAAAVVGNSSSGLIEAPAIGTPTINIGPRQKGRPRAASVIDCDANAGAIAGAIARAIDPEFRRRAAASEPPYGRPGNAARAVLSALLDADLQVLQTKPFYDGPPA